MTDRQRQQIPAAPEQDKIIEQQQAIAKALKIIEWREKQSDLGHAEMMYSEYMKIKELLLKIQ